MPQKQNTTENMEKKIKEIKLMMLSLLSFHYSLGISLDYLMASDGVKIVLYTLLQMPLLQRLQLLYLLHISWQTI